MAIQLGTGVRNALVNSYETTIGTAPVLLLFTGAAPADCQAGTSGTYLGPLPLPVDWMAAASGGTAAKSGTWQGTSVAAGTAAHYRMYDVGTSVCHEQGTVGQGSGDLSLDNVTITSGQTITVTSWTRSLGNA